MPTYDRKRITRLFDEKTEEKNALKQTEPRATVLEKVSQTAFEQLELKSTDVLLDVGTGTGDTALAAASICCQVIGIDVSRKSLEKARQKASWKNIQSVTFAYGAFEEPCAELDLHSYNITKILAVYSLHHLPDPLKKESLHTLTELLRRPGRVVIGDIMFFEDPEPYREEFEKVYYDNGDTDFPSSIDYLTNCLKELGAHIHVERIHPLVGVVRADFV